MFLVFDNLQSAIDCEEHISTIGRELYRDAGYNIVNDEVEITPGKQRIERWAIPQKAHDVDKWFFKSPQEQFPDHYDALVDGHTFETLETIPLEWNIPDVEARR